MLELVEAYSAGKGEEQVPDYSFVLDKMSEIAKLDQHNKNWVNLNRAGLDDLAVEYNSETCPPVNSEDCSILCQNLLTGRVYNSIYQALEASRKFNDYGLDSTNWLDMVDYSNETINISDTLFNQCNSEYIFDHDEVITFNTIRILRAQTFVRLGDFESAQAELILLDGLDCDLNTQTVIECLNSLDAE